MKRSLLKSVILLAAIFGMVKPNMAQNLYVSTYAGTGTAGYQDTIASLARFLRPNSMVIDKRGNMYVCDDGNGAIRKITPAGMVSTFAGGGGQGFADGQGRAAKFNLPASICMDSSGNLYVSDNFNHRIRKIDTTGLVTTIAGNGTGGFADGRDTSARFNHPSGIACSPNGVIYVTDYWNQRVRQIDKSGYVSTLAGDGNKGYLDGPGASAQFNYPAYITVDKLGTVYVGDTYNFRIRKISPNGTVSTFVGSGNAGTTDGTGTNCSFGTVLGMALDPAGNLIVTDGLFNRIRFVTPAGVVTTIAGTGLSGAADGAASQASFNNPVAVVAPDTNLYYIADYDNYKIRKIQVCQLLPPAITVIGPSTVCDGDSVKLSVPANYSNYEWSNGDFNSSIYVFQSGLYKIRVSQAGGCRSGWSNGVQVTVNNLPPVPTISQSGHVLSANGLLGQNFRWQWFNNGAITSPADTLQQLTTTIGGHYTVRVTNKVTGCSNTSRSFTVLGLKNTLASELNFMPNPAKNYLNLNLPNTGIEIPYRIIGNLGKEYVTGFLTEGENKLDISALPTGVYFVGMGEFGFRRFVKE